MSTQPILPILPLLHPLSVEYCDGGTLRSLIDDGRLFDCQDANQHVEPLMVGCTLFACSLMSV